MSGGFPGWQVQIGRGNPEFIHVIRPDDFRQMLGFLPALGDVLRIRTADEVVLKVLDGFLILIITDFTAADDLLDFLHSVSGHLDPGLDCFRFITEGEQSVDFHSALIFQFVPQFDNLVPNPDEGNQAQNHQAKEPGDRPESGPAKGVFFLKVSPVMESPSSEEHQDDVSQDVECSNHIAIAVYFSNTSWISLLMRM